MMNLELVLFPRGGLANRLRALASADLLARSTGRKLYVEWIADHDLGARWDHLFENPLPSRSWGLDALDRLSSDPRYVVCRGGRAFDPAIAQLCDRERGKSIALDGGLLKPVDESGGLHRAKIAFYRGASPPRPDAGRQAFRGRHLYDGYTLGVHIRRTDLNTPFSCIVLRAQDVSPLSAFIEEMEQVLADRPSTKFFVASDEPREEERLRLRFGSRLVTFPKATVARGKVPVQTRP
jgi:hypothetical protein